MIFLIKRFLIFSVPLAFIISCNSKSRPAIIEMEFNVDSTIVDKPEKDSLLNIRYAVPGNWQAVEGADEALKQVDAGKIRICKLLKNPAGSVVFSITDVRQVSDSVFTNMDENYKTVLNPSGNWANVERAEFITAGFQVKQYIMTAQGKTLFKMFFGDRARPSFQVDYSIVIDSAYALNTKTLESIIGSLKRDH
jgi:hypothetical protein